MRQLRSLVERFNRSIERRGVKGTIELCAWAAIAFLADWLLPSRYRSRRQDREFDAKFGVDTRGVIELSELEISSENAGHGVRYWQTKPTDFDKLMRCLRITYKDYVFVDFGSGKGRVLLLASDYPFKKIVGVEFARQLHQAAQVNIRKYRSPNQRCRNFELLCLDVVDYMIPYEHAVLYFYNPFDAEVMARVLGNIYRSLKEFPRNVYLLYLYPVLSDLVQEYGFIEINRGKAGRLSYGVYKWSPGKRTKTQAGLPGEAVKST